MQGVDGSNPPVSTIGAALAALFLMKTKLILRLSLTKAPADVTMMVRRGGLAQQVRVLA